MCTILLTQYLYEIYTIKVCYLLQSMVETGDFDPYNYSCLQIFFNMLKLMCRKIKVVCALHTSISVEFVLELHYMNSWSHENCARLESRSGTPFLVLMGTSFQVMPTSMQTNVSTQTSSLANEFMAWTSLHDATCTTIFEVHYIWSDHPHKNHYCFL